MDNAAQLRLFAPVIKATAAYLVLFFTFMMFQSFSKFYLFARAKAAAKKTDTEKPSLRQIKYASTSGLGFVSDRTFLNMLEQSPAFLTSLWMHAAFVSPASAAQAGWVYIGFRALYPFVFSMGVPWLFISTFPTYGVVWYLAGTTLQAAMKA